MYQKLAEKIKECEESEQARKREQEAHMEAATALKETQTELGKTREQRDRAREESDRLRGELRGAEEEGTEGKERIGRLEKEVSEA